MWKDNFKTSDQSPPCQTSLNLEFAQNLFTWVGWIMFTHCQQNRVWNKTNELSMRALWVQLSSNVLQVVCEVLHGWAQMIGSGGIWEPLCWWSSSVRRLLFVWEPHQKTPERLRLLSHAVSNCRAAAWNLWFIYLPNSVLGFLPIPWECGASISDVYTGAGVYDWKIYGLTTSLWMLQSLC